MGREQKGVIKKNMAKLLMVFAIIIAIAGIAFATVTVLIPEIINNKNEEYVGVSNVTAIRNEEGNIEVQIEAEEGGEIYISTNGEKPTENSNWQEYKAGETYIVEDENEEVQTVSVYYRSAGMEMDVEPAVYLLTPRSGDSGDAQGIAVAIYSETDNSLTFTHMDKLVSGDSGDLYGNKVITEIFTGFEEANYFYRQGVYGTESGVPWHDLRYNVQKIYFDDEIMPISTCGWFSDFYYLTEIDLSGLNTSNVTDMSYMFYDCRSLTNLDLTVLDTRNASDMSSMFLGCYNLQEITLGEQFDFTGSGDNIATTLPTPSGENIEGADGKWYNIETKQGYTPEELANIHSGDVATYVAVLSGDIELPKGYKLLPYIESTGTQFIETEYNPSSNTNIELDFEYISGNSGAWIPILGERVSWSTMFAIWIHQDTKIVGLNYGGTDAGGTNGTNGAGRHLYSNIGNKFYLDGNFFREVSTNSFTSSYPLSIFGLRSSATGTETRNVKGRLYSLKIYESGTLVKDFVPCMNPSGEIGVYDLVNEKFHGNKGTGKFITTLDAYEAMVTEWTIPSGEKTIKLPVLGTVNIKVDWGDGSEVQTISGNITETNLPTHTYVNNTDTDKKYDITIGGTIGSWGSSSVYMDNSGNYLELPTDSNYYTYWKYLSGLKQWGELGVTEYNFTNCKKLKYVSGDSTENTFKNVTTMNRMFTLCTSLETIDLSNFNTSGVTSMGWMFMECNSLTQIDLSSFDTQNVTDMSFMFYNCTSLANLNVSSFNTSKVTSMKYMFYNCTSLANLNVSGFNTAKVTDMGSMFRECKALEGLDLNHFNTSNVTNMTYIFSNCNALKTLKIDNFDTSKITDMNQMFYGCSSLTSLDVSSFNTSNVTNMRGVFYQCKALTNLDVSNFNTSKVTNMNAMFGACNSLTSLNVSSFDTSKVQNMQQMFNGLKMPITLDITSFDTSSVTNMTYMFYNNPLQESILVSNKFIVKGSTGNMFGNLPSTFRVITTSSTPVENQFAGVLPSTANLYVPNDSLEKYLSSGVLSKDRIKPLVEPVSGDVINILKGATYVEKNCTIAGFDINDTANYFPYGYSLPAINGSVNTNEVGTYPVNYVVTRTVKGAVADTNTATRTVNVYGATLVSCFENDKVYNGEWTKEDVVAIVTPLSEETIWVSIKVGNSMWTSDSPYAEISKSGDEFVAIFNETVNNTIYIREIDVDGKATNYESEGKALKIDKTAPQIEEINVVNQDKEIKIKGKGVDSESGLKYYAVSNTIKDTQNISWKECSGTSAEVEAKVPTTGIYYLCFKDEAGNETYSEPITVIEDKAAPNGFLEIIADNTVSGDEYKDLIVVNGNKVSGEKYTNKESVQIKLFAEDNVTKKENIMFALYEEGEYKEIINDNKEIEWKKYEDEVTWVLKAADGKNRIYAIFKDEAGNISYNSEKINYEEKILITFDAVGGIPEAQLREYYSGEKYIDMPIAEMEGYEFDGWYTSKDSGILITEDTKVDILSDNTTLYAHWKKKEAIAIYSETDNSLTFYKTANVPEEGQEYNGKVATVVYTGIETSTYTAKEDVPWNNYATSIKTVMVEDKISPISTAYWFYEMNNAETISVANLDTSNVTTMRAMFVRCMSVKSLDVENWNTSKVDNMRAVFQACISLAELDLSKWDMSNVNTTRGMFLSTTERGEMQLRSIGDVNGWNTKNIKEMEGMFQYCANLEDIDVSNWDVSNVENMRGVFWGCKSLKVLDVSKWKTGKAIDMQSLFQNCVGLQELDLSKWDTTNVTNMYMMFAGTILYGDMKLTTVGDISNWNTKNVTNMSAMFQMCEELTDLDLSNWNTENVKDMGNMFYNCTNLQEVTLGPNFKFVGTNGYLPVQSSSNIPGADGKWYIANTNTGYAPSEIPARTEVTTYTAIAPVTKVAFAVYSESDTTLRFYKQPRIPLTGEEYNGKIVTAVYQGIETDIYTNRADVPWNAYASVITNVVVEDKISPVATRRWFDCFEKVTSMNLEKLDTSKVTDMAAMFQRCLSLEALDVSHFDTSNVTLMTNMFYRCLLIEELDLSSWNVGKVTNMQGMFGTNWSQSPNDVVKLKTIGDISNWDTKNVTTMYSMFQCVENITELDLSNWNTEKIKDMSHMFNGCRRLTSLNLSSFNTKSVTTMESMFDKCTKLQEITLGPTFNFVGTNGYLLAPSASNISGADGKWYIANTNNGYAPSEIPARTEVTTYTAIAPVAYAVYSAEDTTLRMYKSRNVPTAGEEYNGKIATAVYTGIEKDTYAAKTNVPWNKYITTITNAVVVDKITPVSTQRWFDGATNLVSTNLDKLDTSNVTTMLCMFQNCKKLEAVDVSSWNTSKVTDFGALFSNCEKISELDVSNWDTAKVTRTRLMFQNCKSIQELDLSNWNTSNVTDMYMMFGASGKNNMKLKTVGDISNWNTGKVTTMAGMFQSCTELTSLDLSSWNVSNVTTMQSMFGGVEDIGLRMKLTTIGNVGNWNTGKVTAMNGMFQYCTALRLLDVSGWNTANVTNMSGMFNGCEALTSLNVSGWNTANVTNMNGMFYGCAALTTLNVSGWNTASVTNMNGMFYGCEALTTLDVSAWNTANVTNMSGIFDGCVELISLDVSGWNVGKVTTMASMFAGHENNPMKLTTIGNVSNWNTENVTNMSNMFTYCTSLTELNLTNWNVGKVTTMENMFCSTQATGEMKLATVGDLSNWDTKNVTNMIRVFQYCTKITTLGEKLNWNVEKVEKMTQMFNYCSSLEKLDLSSWNTLKLTVMDSMFQYCIKLESLNLSNFNTSLITSMNMAFYSCTKLQEVTLGPNFKWTLGTGYLPGLYSSDIPGADGKWYDTNTGIGYAPIEIPERSVATTYTAVPAYKVRFEANGGTIYDLGDTFTERTVTLGSAYGAGGNFPEAVKEGYTFLGWYTSGDSETLVTADTIVDETAKGLTLYARWKAENVQLINFTISGVSYEAEKGMTWAEWIGSKYDNIGMASTNDIMQNNNVLNAAGSSLINSSNDYIYMFDEIEANENYTFVAGGFQGQ